NGLLATGAGFVVWQGRHDPGPSVVGWLGALTSAGTLALFVGLAALGMAAIEGWVLIQLLRQNGRLLGRVEALEAQVAANNNPAPPPHPGALALGSPARAFPLSALEGCERRLKEFLDKPRVIVFFSPQCGFCQQMAPRIGRLPDGGASLLLVGQGDAEEHR